MTRSIAEKGNSGREPLFSWWFVYAVTTASSLSQCTAQPASSCFCRVTPHCLDSPSQDGSLYICALTSWLFSAGFLATKDQQKTVYGLLAVVWGAIAAAKILATQAFFEHVFGTASAHVGLFGLQRLSGFSALAPAVAAYTMAVSLPSRLVVLSPPACRNPAGKIFQVCSSFCPRVSHGFWHG